MSSFATLATLATRVFLSSAHLFLARPLRHLDSARAWHQALAGWSTPSALSRALTPNQLTLL